MAEGAKVESRGREPQGRVEAPRKAGYFCLMRLLRLRRAAPAALFVGAFWGCDAADQTVPGIGGDASASAIPRYSREFTFLGTRDGEPIAVPLVFRAVERPDGLRRSIRGWLAHGPIWDAFLNEQWNTSRTGGVWRLWPRGSLRFAATADDEIEAIWYRRGERSLRLEPGRALSGWNGGQYSRYRVRQGQLRLGGERISGLVVEAFETGRVGSGAEPDPEENWLLLTDGGDLRVFLIGDAGAPGGSEGFAWVGKPESEETAPSLRITPEQLQPLERARRTIPLAWSFSLPSEGMTGRVQTLGLAAYVGTERAGRRAVEVRYTVSGWVEIEGERRRVRGVARHRAG